MDPWSVKIPLTAEQLGLCSTTMNPPPRLDSPSFLDSHDAVPLLFLNHWLQSLMAVSVPFACLFRRLHVHIRHVSATQTFGG